MVLLILAGLFALAFGTLSITRTLVLRDKYARLYGVALIVAALPVSAIATALVGAVMPGVVADNGPLAMIISLAVCIVTAVGLAVPFHRWQQRENAGVPA
jgi:uncharacterized YccA/Bax inhibitor family protein